MNNTVNQKSAIAYVEILEIIKNLEPELSKKIPNKIINFFEENKAKDYEYSLDKTKDFSEQVFTEETGGLLALLFLNYLGTEEENKEVKNALISNENKYQEELREKYNPDEIFKNKNQDNETQETKALTVIEKLPWYKKIINSILSIFKK